MAKVYPEFYACTAQISKGGARCRNNAASCTAHADKGVRAPRPEVVLVKINLLDEEAKLFRKEGLSDERRSLHRSEVLRAMHAKQAQDLGRATNSYRKDEVDSGTAIFDPPGVKQQFGIRGRVEASGLVAELTGEGFVLTDAVLLVPAAIKGRSGTRVRLLMQFEKTTEGALEEFPWRLLNDFAGRGHTFGMCHVYANPMNHEGLVVHTVNLGGTCGLDDAEYMLRFDDGLWEAEPIVQNA